MLNVHPILVHFPIALFTLYSLLELLPFKKIRKLPFLFYTKAIILICGFLFSIPTILAGELIESTIAPQVGEMLVNYHSLFAFMSVTVYGVLVVLYFLEWLKKDNISLPFIQGKTKKILFGLSGNLFQIWTVLLLSIIGLILISITGALGGIIVYGKNLDPFTQIIYSLFFH